VDARKLPGQIIVAGTLSRQQVFFVKPILGTNRSEVTKDFFGGIEFSRRDLKSPFVTTAIFGNCIRRFPDSPCGDSLIIRRSGTVLLPCDESFDKVQVFWRGVRNPTIQFNQTGHFSPNHTGVTLGSAVRRKDIAGSSQGVKTLSKGVYWPFATCSN
jgi:hypothetical protein